MKIIILGKATDMPKSGLHKHIATMHKPFGRLAETFGRKQPPVFFTSSVILLLLVEEPAHGYALFKKMCTIGIFDEAMDASVIYPTLRMLDAKGCISSELVDEGAGPARKVFHITEGGLEMLELWSAHLRDVSSAIGYFQKRYEAARAAAPSTRKATTR
jgi:PadR family transcriptional regulator PadR